MVYSITVQYKLTLLFFWYFFIIFSSSFFSSSSHLTIYERKVVSFWCHLFSNVNINENINDQNPNRK